MRTFIFAILAMTFSLTAYAGFDGYNGNTQLGIFNKIQCSTGLTCTRYKDQFQVVSSPSIAGSSLTVTAAASTAANIYLQADNNATNGDSWDFQSTVSQGGLSFLNNTSGSQVQKMLLTTGGNLSITGTFTPAGAIIPSGGIQLTGGVTPLGGSTFSPFAVSSTSGVGTSTTPSATTVYLTEVMIPWNTTLTGIAVNNAATCGTNKYIVALFNSSGAPVANSTTAGVTCSGANAWQDIPFTSTYAAMGPQIMYAGVYMNGTTDRFYTIPAAGEYVGIAGTVTGQSFGAVTSVSSSLPTTFTAGTGVIVHTY